MPNGRTGRFFTDIWRSASDMRFYGEAAARPFGAALRHLAKVALLLGAVLAAQREERTIDEERLTTWMYEHLRVIAIPVADADALDQLETRVLGALDPPLNLAKMPRTPVRDRLTDLRRRIT